MKRTKNPKSLDSEFLSCRDEGHNWYEIPPEEWGPEVAPAAFGWLRYYVCNRCDTKRRMIINALGEVAVRSYAYPEGYQLEEWTPSKAPFRKEVARRRGIHLARMRKHP